MNGLTSKLLPLGKGRGWWKKVSKFIDATVIITKKKFVLKGRKIKRGNLQAPSGLEGNWKILMY